MGFILYPRRFAGAGTGFGSWLRVYEFYIRTDFTSCHLNIHGLLISRHLCKQFPAEYLWFCSYELDHYWLHAMRKKILKVALSFTNATFNLTNLITVASIYYLCFHILHSLNTFAPSEFRQIQIKLYCQTESKKNFTRALHSWMMTTDRERRVDVYGRPVVTMVNQQQHAVLLLQCGRKEKYDAS